MNDLNFATDLDSLGLFTETDLLLGSGHTRFISPGPPSGRGGSRVQTLVAAIRGDRGRVNPYVVRKILGYGFY